MMLMENMSATYQGTTDAATAVLRSDPRTIRKYAWRQNSKTVSPCHCAKSCRRRFDGAPYSLSVLEGDKRVRPACVPARSMPILAVVVGSRGPAPPRTARAFIVTVGCGIKDAFFALAKPAKARTRRMKIVRTMLDLMNSRRLKWCHGINSRAIMTFRFSGLMSLESYCTTVRYIRNFKTSICIFFSP